ncbi:piggyBac transposable element-derived protein 4-like isoform X2 [Eurosta solidaginis]|uniref:piggyBac transposable element-derived protein 4-like isoform X2 n=1 Tax=Eurosta solidaginis TaxID=178769 RepID=UPI003530E361
MDHEKQQEHLQKMFDECCTDDSSEEDPYQTDGDGDSDYVMENSSSSDDDVDSDEESACIGSDGEANDSGSDDVEADENIDSETDDVEADENDKDWHDTVSDIPNFNFDSTSSGIKIEISDTSSPIDVFNKVFNNNIMELLISCTNEYGLKLSNQQRGLCLLQGQIKVPKIRQLFSKSALYYHPAFSATMSGRRFEQILRCLTANHVRGESHMAKISNFVKLINQSFQAAFWPSEQIVLDESLLLHKGRLVFRQYIKSKRARFGIKFFQLCDSSSYVLNIETYKGKQPDPTKGSKIDAIVYRLVTPYFGKGHHLFLDNYYNSINLSHDLLLLKTHTTGTLRSNRKGNPIEVTKKKLKTGQYIWKRQGKVYVSKWYDKRDVLCITTGYSPRMVITKNRFGVEKSKPLEIVRYNEFMGGVDRTDQMNSYYSSPRKTIRWYKKVIFRMLDLAVHNSFLLYKKRFPAKSKMEFLTFREELIYAMIDLPKSKFHPEKPSRKRRLTVPIQIDHFLENIPRKGTKKQYIRCRQCSKNGVRKETSVRCAGCEVKPGLCVGNCFTDWHQQQSSNLE